MGQIYSEQFDLEALLMYRGLNVRHFAEVNPSFTVSEYFGLVSELLNIAPDVSRALTNFENRKGDKDDRQSLNDMINLLDEMECEEFIIEFHAILDSYEREGNWRLAATYAKRVRGSFNDFHERILKTKKEYDEKSRPDQENEAFADGAETLEAAIRRIDEESAARLPVVLAVDDSPVILKTVWSILKDEYKVLTLPKPAEIDKILQNQTPDLFLLDYMMPELNGFELIPIIRSYEKHANTPIIFLTSEGSIDSVTSALALGARDYIVKPFKPETLRDKVGKHIGKG